MAKYISSIRDLVIQAITNGSKIEADAKNNSAEACFQMGMIHLLGISSPIDFKKATVYFGNQSLTSDSDSNRLLGFIAECEGNYSEAFKYYVKAKEAVGKDKNVPLYNKVFEERNHLQKFLKENGLPSTVLNKDVSAILNEYVKGGTSRFDASAKIATICNDEPSCLEVAQVLYDMGDFYAAKRWLQYGNVSNTNELYVSVEEKFAKDKKGLNLPNTIEILEIEGSSLLEESNTESSYIGSKYICDETAKLCTREWVEQASLLINIIKKGYNEEEEARIRRQKEEEEEAARKREKEEAARKRKEEEDALQAQFEKKIKNVHKTNRIVNKIYIFFSTLFILLMIVSYWGYSKTEIIQGMIFTGVCLAIFYLPFHIIKWIAKKIIMR